MYKNTEIIAEVKTESPFGYKAKKSWEELFAIANEVGDITSIHTDERWGGSFDLLQRARALTKKPILAKGIHHTDEQIEKAVDSGADWVLVVGRIPQAHQEKCLIEPRTLEELKTIPRNLRAVWNERDLASGGVKKETFQEARNIFKGWLCQASNIKSVQDIQPGANAVLVGTNLPEFTAHLLRYT